MARRSDVAVRLVVGGGRRPEDRGGLDLARLRAPVLALGALEAFLPQRDARSVGHDADERYLAPGVFLRVAFVLREVADGIVVQPDDLPHGVGGNPERVLRGEVPRGVDDGVYSCGSLRTRCARFL